MDTLEDDAGTSPIDAGSRERAPGVLATWRYTVVSLIFITAVLYLMLFLFLAESSGPLSWRTGTAVAAAVVSFITAVRYFWFFRAGLGSGMPPLRYTLLLLLPPLAVMVLGAVPPSSAEGGVPLWRAVSALPLWMGVNCLAVLVQRRRRLAVLAAGVAIVVLHQAMMTGTMGGWSGNEVFPPVSMFLYAAVLPLAFIGGVWWWDIVVQLDNSRRTAGQLAVTRERLRFASDLHDIQGHHLQVIALKTELAERLLDADPTAAKQQIHEAQELARTALVDTRTLVRGYRRTDLATEAANAADVLQAAGIRCTVDLDHEVPDAGSQQLFGIVIRESTTNILRHSEARNVSMVLRPVAGATCLTIRNDGVEPARAAGSSNALGANSVVGTEADSSGSEDGTGLTGLRERFAAAGGDVTGTPDGTSFELVAELPA